MTIATDVKQKLKESNRLHEEKQRQQQNIQAIKGFVILMGVVGSIIFLSLIFV